MNIVSFLWSHPVSSQAPKKKEVKPPASGKPMTSAAGKIMGAMLQDGRMLSQQLSNTETNNVGCQQAKQLGKNIESFCKVYTPERLPEVSKEDWNELKQIQDQCDKYQCEVALRERSPKGKLDELVREGAQLSDDQLKNSDEETYCRVTERIREMEDFWVEYGASSPLDITKKDWQALRSTYDRYTSIYT